MRPEFPSEIIPELKYLIECMWNKNPDIRPHMSQVLDSLNEIQ